ncbi:hypothetical protein COOONC_26277 [Cooperia oncophora]
MRGRMTLSELNDIVGKLDEFLSMKRSLLNAPFKKLSMKDKDQVCKWKEAEPAPIAGQLFCQEADVKPLMKDRSKTLFRTALPCLRHVRRPTWYTNRIWMAGTGSMFHMTVEVVGTRCHQSAKITETHVYKRMDLRDQKRAFPKRQSKREQHSNDEVILDLMPYEQVKKLYPEELFAYMESTFSLPDEMCAAFEKDDSSKKASRKKKKSTK